MTEIGLLVSGNLGLLVFHKIISQFQINFVLTDRLSGGIIAFCEENKIPYYSGNPRNGKALRALPNISCTFLVSVNYLFLIERDIIELPEKLAVNFHGSLLPKYRGRTPHVWAIINNERETGVTAHVIDDNCDTGDIISQKIIPIDPHDTGGKILKKYNNIYPAFVSDVLKNLITSSFILKKQDNTLATYFGKRSEHDGQIDWNWQRERINNWIRAQAKPYPGAFSYINNRKIIIHRIQFSSRGFNYDMVNGLVLDFNSGFPIIKTANGCIELVDYICDEEIKIKNILK